MTTEKSSQSGRGRDPQPGPGGLRVSLSRCPVEQNDRPDKPSVFTPQARHDLCARCAGLMVIEQHMDLQDDTGQIDITALRCTSCGGVIDQVILENRFKPAPNLLYGTRQ